jgi:HIRAN domain
LATRTPRVPDVEDKDPSDILRRVQAGMSAARLSVPLDEQIEIVGEQFYPKEFRKLFRKCGMPITAAGCTLESEVCFLVPEPWNPHDPNAVAVMVRTFHVGYLPAALARRYHGRLIPYAQRRQVVSGNARIWSQLESGGIVRARVTVVVPGAAVL